MNKLQSSFDILDEPMPDDGFDDFWRVYPKRVEKKAARKMWEKAIKKSSPATIISGARRYAEYCHERISDSHYIKHPQRWLRDERWTDELESVPKPEKKRTANLIAVDFMRGR